MRAQASTTASVKESAPAPAQAVAVKPQAVFKSPILLQRKCACGGGCPGCKEEEKQTIQTKATVNTPGDAFEQEADRIADVVVSNAPSPPHAAPLVSSITPLHAGLVQAKPVSAPSPQTTAVPAGPSRGRAPPPAHAEAHPTVSPAASDTDAQVEVLPQHFGSGRSLDGETRSYMESRFGAAFDHVKIHDGAPAAHAARSVNALAYTVGSDIVFGSGQFAPTTSSGKKLLAHELTHVLQQGGRTSPHIQRKEQGPGEVANEETVEGAGTAQDDRQECPKVPTGLGNVPPDPPCPLATFTPSPTELARIHFCLDSDSVLPSENLADLDAMIREQPAATRFVIQGFASSEGDPQANLRLSCHRARKIEKELEKRLRASLATSGMSPESIKAQILKRIETGARGPTSEFSGGREANRVVVVFGQIPGLNVGFEPACELAPRHLGDIKPEIPCDAPTVNLVDADASDQVASFHFCQDSDVLVGEIPQDIADFAHGRAAASTFVVHGFASKEGDPDSNQRLSCHRALRIARELINAGVAPAKIREVSGLGTTEKFGDAKHLEQNRVALVLAEKGEIEPIAEATADPLGKDDANIRDQARNTLLASQYRLEADSYISFWTCGRTASLREAVKRLAILLPEEADARNPPRVELTSKANGSEESIGPNNIRLSTNALRADNPVECTMGRIIDMAFHHAVKGDTDLAPLSGDDAAIRHQAGLHLIHLAGLTECTGNFARFRPGHGRESGGIDKPLVADPLGLVAPLACARTPQPTRLAPPLPGQKGNERPDFIVFEKDLAPSPGKGTLKPVDVKRVAAGEKLIHSAAITTTEQDILKASASVGMVGAGASAFNDYEIGFVQTILNDLTTADYTSGDQVLHKLPTPIRAAQKRGETSPPEPWMSLQAFKKPDSKGIASGITGSWQMDTDFAPFLSFFRAPDSEDRIDRLDFLHRKTTVGIWIAAHKIGTPLDRFSVIFIDGAVFDVLQDFEVDVRRVGGELHADDIEAPGVEHEDTFGTGTFAARQTSDAPSNDRDARLLNPASSEIDLNRQQRAFRALKAPANGLSVAEFKEIVREILDNIQIFGSEDDMRNNTNATTSPRLGFEFSPLKFTVPINRSSGRIGGNEPVLTAPGLGDIARFHLVKALALRLQKNDFLKKGKSIALGTQAANSLPGSKTVGNIEIFLDRREAPPDLSSLQGDDANVIDNMAEMFVCTDLTNQMLDGREFGATYSIDRTRRATRSPSPTFQMSGPEDDCSFRMELPCDPARTGMLMGTVHTHPGCIPEDPAQTANPSSTDLASSKAGKCGTQHFVLSKFGVKEYSTGQPVRDRQDITNQLKSKVKTTTCRQVKSPDDLDKKPANLGG